jgi:hypothetical protein
MHITLERQAIFESLTHRTHTDQSYDYVIVGDYRETNEKNKFN